MPRKKLTSTEKHRERMADAKVIDRLVAEQQDLATLLRFDPERGGRRYRELVIQKALGYPRNVVLNLTDAFVTVEQAKIIQKVLHLSPPRQVSVLWSIEPD